MSWTLVVIDSAEGATKTFRVGKAGRALFAMLAVGLFAAGVWVGITLV